MKLIDVVVGGAGFVRSAFGLVEVKKGDAGPNWHGAVQPTAKRVRKPGGNWDVLGF